MIEQRAAAKTGRPEGARLGLALGLLGLWSAVYGAGVHQTGTWRLSAETLLRLGALRVPLPTPLSGGEAARLGLTWLVHVDPQHLLGSALVLLGLAFLWPRSVGKLVAALVLCGLAGSLTALGVYAGRSVVSAGPSGALLGAAVVGAALPQRVVRRVLLLVLGGALLLGPGKSDHAAHLGGAVAGAVLGAAAWLRARRDQPPS